MSKTCQCQLTKIGFFSHSSCEVVWVVSTLSHTCTVFLGCYLRILRRISAVLNIADFCIVPSETLMSNMTRNHLSLADTHSRLLNTIGLHSILHSTFFPPPELVLNIFLSSLVLSCALLDGSLELYLHVLSGTFLSVVGVISHQGTVFQSQCLCLSRSPRLT